MYHLGKPPTVSGQQLVFRRTVTARGTSKQLFSVFVDAPHGTCSPH
jgi:hypothetical protein